MECNSIHRLVLYFGWLQLFYGANNSKLVYKVPKLLVTVCDFNEFTILFRLFTPILSYLHPKMFVQPKIPPKVVFKILFSRFPDLCRNREIWMENLRYLVILIEFSIVLGLFAPILSYLYPKMAVNAQNTT